MAGRESRFSLKKKALPNIGGAFFMGHMFSTSGLF